MNIPGYKNVTFISSLDGSTGAKLYKNSTAKKWVIKQSSKGEGGFEQVKTEALVDDIYEALGIRVPKHKLDVENKALILEYIDGKILGHTSKAEYDTAAAELRKGFIVDALLANWDVIGMHRDNIILPKDGSSPVRIDNGGSLTFKATGGKKPFTKVVSEINTMRNKSISPTAYEVFGSLTDTEIDNQIKTIIVPNYDKILSLTPDELKETMKARMDDLIERTVWMNASTFKNNVVETSMPEYIPQIQTTLVKLFYDGWRKNFISIHGPMSTTKKRLLEFINKTLKENDAIIGGGYILKSIGIFDDKKSVDIDIYVPHRNADRFKDIMRNLFDYYHIIKEVQSSSSVDFFKKIGIEYVIKYAKEDNSNDVKEMDIVVVKDDVLPQNIVKNSDLTFCENWYDGENVYMTHPLHVRDKFGYLENHYLGMFFEGNPILINRIIKYINRGFKIFINHPIRKSLIDVTNNSMKHLMLKSYQYGTQILPVSSSYATSGTNEIEYYFSKNNIIDEFPVVKYNNANIKEFNFDKIIDIDYIVDKPLNTRSLTDVDILIIKNYTQTGYTYINNFLHSRPIQLYLPKDKIYNFLVNKFPQENSEPDQVYNQRIFFYYFVNLYNSIQKAQRIVDEPFVVYRGTKTWYLAEDPTKFYYMNSFVSTTPLEAKAKEFGTIPHSSLSHNISNYKKYVYAFYIHPLCYFRNLTQLSAFSSEKEFLFTPYHRYLYIGKNKIINTTYKNYIIFPTDLDIPTTVDTFIPWKNQIATLSKEISEPEYISGIKSKITVDPFNALKAILANTGNNQNNNQNKKISENNSHSPNKIPVGNNIKLLKQIVEENNTTEHNSKTNNQSGGVGYVRKSILKSSKIPQNRYKTQKNIISKNKLDKTQIIKKNKNVTKKNKNKINEINKITEINKINSENATKYKNSVDRFIEPIPSFPGKKPTDLELTIIKKMILLINQKNKSKE
jgi:hypothetical protein